MPQQDELSLFLFIYVVPTFSCAERNDDSLRTKAPVTRRLKSGPGAATARAASGCVSSTKSLPNPTSRSLKFSHHDFYWKTIAEGNGLEEYKEMCRDYG